jgi:hypothetical protein
MSNISFFDPMIISRSEFLVSCLRRLVTTTRFHVVQ